MTSFVKAGARPVFLSMCLLWAGYAMANDDVAAALAEVRKSDNFHLIVAGSAEQLGLGADIGPYVDALSNPAVQSTVANQVNAMGGGWQAGAAGVVGAAIGGAIANAMIESDMREQARAAVRPIMESMGESDVGRIAFEASKRSFIEVLGFAPKNAAFRTDMSQPFDVELKFQNVKRAVVMMVQPETTLSLDRNKLRTIVRISIARIEQGKRRLLVNCPIAHSTPGADEPTPQHAIARWRADNGKLARAALSESYEDAVRTFLTLTQPTPQDETLEDFAMLVDRVLVGGRARLVESAAERHVFESESCGATVYHAGRRMER